MKDTLITFAVLATLPTAALAKGSADPKLPKEVQAIHCMVGSWTAKNATVNLDGKKRKGDMTITCSPTAGGFGVLCTTKITVEGLGSFDETDLFGWNPQSQTYHWYAVTSMGESHDHVAKPPTEKNPTLMFAYSGFQDGKPMQEVLKLTFSADFSKFEFRNDGVVGGQAAWSIVAAFAKK